MGIVVSLSAVEVFTARAAMAAPTTPVSLTATCAGTNSPPTFTLTANCDTTASLTVPSTITTVDGNGFTIYGA
jgi:hypothetical protein